MSNKFIILENDCLNLRLSLKGGSIVDATYKNHPILRPYVGDEVSYDVSKAASFPLVPFGNRVEDNIFEFEGVTYTLKPNIKWDRHFLHGEAWISDWALLNVQPTEVEMEYICDDSPFSPYRYRAYQKINIKDNCILMQLSVENSGDVAMPFGLGHHPFFYQDRSTTLKAKADYYYTEKHDFLPDEKKEIPRDLNFTRHQVLPMHWVNNGFGGWNGKAQILWGNQNIGADISVSKNFTDYFIFVSDIKFDANYQNDFFCFEPMTHHANAHQDDVDALQILEPKEQLITEFRINLFDLISSAS